MTVTQYSNRYCESNHLFEHEKKRHKTTWKININDFEFFLNRIALSIPLENGAYSRCLMFDVNYTDILNEIQPAQLYVNQSWPTKECFAWSYNFTDIPYQTISTEVSANEKSSFNLL